MLLNLWKKRLKDEDVLLSHHYRSLKRSLKRRCLRSEKSQELLLVVDKWHLELQFLLVIGSERLVLVLLLVRMLQLL